jgi:hypothetical protein
MKRTRRILLVGTIAVIVLAVVASFEPLRSTLRYLWGKARGGYSITQRVEQLGHFVKKRLSPAFEGAGVKYPPAGIFGAPVLSSLGRLHNENRISARDCRYRHVRPNNTRWEKEMKPNNNNSVDRLKLRLNSVLVL